MNEPVERVTSVPTVASATAATSANHVTPPQAASVPATPRESKDREPKLPTSAQNERSSSAVSQQSAKSDATKNGVVDVDPAWLERIQKCNWGELIQFTSERDWASKTATLRTLEQLPRSEIKEAQAAGKLLAEAEGIKGKYQLLEWGESIVLLEQRGNRHNYFVVKRLHAISWETYVWYLTRFGRTTPLAVAMSLLPLWRQGKPNTDGRVQVTKTGISLEMYLNGDQLNVTESEQSTDVA